VPKEWNEETQKQNYKDFRDNYNYRSNWAREAVKFEDARYGIHFSRADEKELLAFRQAPLPVSVITAICDTAEAMMLSSQPTVKVAPIIHPFDENLTQISKSVSAVYDYLIKKSWYDSLGALQHDRVIRDSSNVGHGLYYIVPRNEYGEFNVDIKHLNWRYFYPHPLTKSPFYDDSDNMVIAMNLSKKSAYRFVKSIENDITYEQFEKDFLDGAPSALVELAQMYRTSVKSTDSVVFIQRLQLEDQFMYLAIPNKANINYQETELRYKIYSDLTDDLKKLERENKIKIIKQRRNVLTEYTSIGKLGYKVVYPIDMYNIVPLVYDHRDTPYPIGRTWYLYPLQRVLDKFMMIALINGSLMNSLRILYEEGSISNIDEWKKNFSMPGAMLSWSQTVPGYTKPPQILESKPLTEAWLQFPRYIMYLMEYVMGIFGVNMGDNRESPSVFSTVASLQSASGQKIRRRLAQSDAALSIVGKVVANFYKEYAPPNGFVSNINADGQLDQTIAYNVLKLDDNKVTVAKETDLSFGFKDVRFTSQSSNGFESGTEAALLTNLATQLKVPQLLPLILKRINVPDVDKVLTQIDQVSQQNATIEQMQQAIKDLEGRSKILANQVMQKGFETEVAKFSAKLKGAAVPLEPTNVGQESQLNNQSQQNMEQ